MAWVAVDKDGTEWVFASKPIRRECTNEWIADDWENDRSAIVLPDGMIEKIIGFPISWASDTIELE